MVEKDYIMRLLHEMVGAMIKLIFSSEEEEPSALLTDANSLSLYNQYIALADEGKINEAENRLYRERDTENMEHLKVALLFYSHINDYTDEKLASCEYTREEIKDGINDALQDFGYNGFDGIEMMDQLFA